MIFKIIGVILVVSGCGGFGFLIALAHRKEIKLLKVFIKCVDHISNELRCRHTSLPDLCRQAANISGDTVGVFFRLLQKEMDIQISPNAATCTDIVLSHMSDLPESLKEILQELGESLGRFDVEGQLENLENVKQRAISLKMEKTENIDVRMRSYQTLSLCAGAALAILFI